jgi:hypothetical protein
MLCDRRVLLGSMFALSLGACGSSQSAPADATSAASQRLSGNWRLLSFEPSLALEEPIKGLLDAQLKTLTISFANGEFTATGPGVNTSGPIKSKAQRATC